MIQPPTRPMFLRLGCRHRPVLCSWTLSILWRIILVRKRTWESLEHCDVICLNSGKHWKHTPALLPTAHAESVAQLLKTYTGCIEKSRPPKTCSFCSDPFVTNLEKEKLYRVFVLWTFFSFFHIYFHMFRIFLYLLIYRKMRIIYYFTVYKVINFDVLFHQRCDEWFPLFVISVM